MNQLYPNLTGKKLLRSVSRLSLRRCISTGLIILFLAAFCLSLTVACCMEIKEFWWFFFTAPAWFLIFYFLVKKLRTHIEDYRDVESHAVFAAYGTPDEIAAVLSDPCNEQLLDSRSVILTKSYLMMRKDYLTYLPLSEIKMMAVRAFTGKINQVYLEVFPQSGSKCIYRFEKTPVFRSVIKRQEEIEAAVREHMAVYSPECKIYMA